ncbi:MAG: ABC transporter substrate-binding protein [Promethearchaeota archaeon]
MEMEKKNIAILILAIALVASGVGNVIFLIPTPVVPEDKITFVFGTGSGPSDLDPIRSWDSASNDVIEQVAEGLYMYNLSDPDLKSVPRLAADYGTWDVTGKHYTVPLRRGVFFHDGTPFNAAAVNFTFSRINWFINASGTLPASVGISQIHSLYEFPNGTTILDPTNPVTINDEYSVTINLRAPYAVFEKLICYVTAYMLSPTATPLHEYIETADGVIVGTGPFVYDHYIADTEVKFHRWDRYWRTGAYFEEVTFAIIEDQTTRNNAMLGHTIDYLSGSSSSLFPTYDADPTITHRSGGRAMSYYYLGMNTKRINQTWRQAISWSINYTYIIDELSDGTVYRSNGPLAPDFPGYNSSIKAATWDLAKARTIVQSMGFATGLTADNETTGSNADAWRALDIVSWNYSYNTDNEFRADLGVLLKDNLDLIGIDVVDQGMSWSDFIYRAYGYMEPGGYDSLMLYWIGWGPDYLSPFNMIAPLFSNKSSSDSAQYYNADVEQWLADVLVETNATKREILYSKILHQIVEVDMPHAFGYHPYQHSVHSADIKGVAYNAMGNFYVYPIYREPSEY